MGAAVACNLGWSMVATDYYLRIDNDILFKNNWLNEMILCLNEDISTGIMSCACLSKSNLVQFKTKSGRKLLFHQYNEITPGGCMLISKKTFSKLGFFCEDYGTYGPEDGDYSIRCDIAGLKRYYISDLDAATHIGAEQNTLKHIQQKTHFSPMNGMLSINRLLYEFGFRNIHMHRKFIPYIENDVVTFTICKEYINKQKKQKMAAKKIFEDRKLYLDTISK